ncbi:prepilin-type N-terminal cleavage/methylation domain-containing protein [Thiorhodococcus fuscus]|uniref:Prepilin-type N-terminal cleavage/methylation domain-containing protein n=1 Tax=Thiorhodococcus fuscus TaxID=527200 RepID=A0ABW4YBX8_9GAMM
MPNDLPQTAFLGFLIIPLIRARSHGFTLVELMLTVLIVAILTSIAMASYSHLMQKTQFEQAKSDMVQIESAMERFYVANQRYPDDLAELGGGFDSLLDPWGNPYQYLNIAKTKGKGKLRKDHNLVPLNTDYDLYSMGADGRSASPLTAKISRDDIVRANNGGYLGLASDY